MVMNISNIRWGFQKAIEIQNGTTTLEEVMKEIVKQIIPEKLLLALFTMKAKLKNK